VRTGQAADTQSGLHLEAGHGYTRDFRLIRWEDRHANCGAGGLVQPFQPGEHGPQHDCE
jgi:hypothetical protein